MFKKKSIYEFIMVHVDVIYPDGYAFLTGLNIKEGKNVGYSYATLAYVTDDNKVFDFCNNVYLSNERDPNEISYVIRHYEIASTYCPVFNKKMTKRKALKAVQEYYPGFYDIF